MNKTAGVYVNKLFKICYFLDSPKSLNKLLLLQSNVNIFAHTIFYRRLLSDSKINSKFKFDQVFFFFFFSNTMTKGIFLKSGGLICFIIADKGYIYFLESSLNLCLFLGLGFCCSTNKFYLNFRLYF